jgi:hypothetical protein
MKLMNIKTKDYLHQNWLLLTWFYPFQLSNMNMLFEFVSMTLNNHMFKVNLSRFIRNSRNVFILQVV